MECSLADVIVPGYNRGMNMFGFGELRRRRRDRARYGRLQAQIAEASSRDDMAPTDEPFPFPPPRLRHRVHGDVTRDSFTRAGQHVTADLMRLLADAGIPPRSIGTALDFGCGCGRVLRYVRSELLETAICGADIDTEAIEWCRANLGFARFVVNESRAAMPFPDRHFDLIYGISVFTHLDEDMQNFWLAELQRVARPGGILILSVHGASIYERNLSASKLRSLRRDGIRFDVRTTGRFKVDGLPDFYQMAYHTRDYIERVWTRYFSIIDYVPQGIVGHQDAVVLRR